MKSSAPTATTWKYKTQWMSAATEYPTQWDRPNNN
jgi:hypothetical protein